MAKISVHVFDEDYFNFRRWLKARDPRADFSVRPAADGLWLVTADLTKPYLQAIISRRWRAA